MPLLNLDGSCLLLPAVSLTGVTRVLAFMEVWNSSNSPEWWNKTKGEAIPVSLCMSLTLNPYAETGGHSSCLFLFVIFSSITDFYFVLQQERNEATTRYTGGDFGTSKP